MAGRRPPSQGFRFAPAAAMDVHDDVLGLILERVDSHVSLIRAAAVCRRWRRAIADAAFLRRFRSLHAPAVAGEYHNGPWHPRLTGRRRTFGGPVFVPASPPLVAARHFSSLDFLPNGAGYWPVVDTRGSLLLMCSAHNRSVDILMGRALSRIVEMLVCEPLTRRYMVVPPPPNFDDSCYRRWGSYLVDGDDGDKASGCIGLFSFRVLCIYNRNAVTHVAMFTAGLSWSKKNIDHIAPSLWCSDFLGRASGSPYFYANGTKGGMLINLDGSTGDFTSSAFPAIGDWNQRYNCFITEGRDGKPRILTFSNNTMKMFSRLGDGEWALERSVMLSEATHGLPRYQPSFFSNGQDILTLGTGYVTLLPHFAEPWPYSIDLETMEAELATGDMEQMVFRCELPWPPALHVCLDS